MIRTSPNSPAAEALIRLEQQRLGHGAIDRASTRLGWDSPRRAYRQIEGVIGNPCHLSLFLELLVETPPSCVQEIGNEIVRPFGLVTLPLPPAGDEGGNVHEAHADVISAFSRLEAAFGRGMADGQLDQGERVEMLIELEGIEGRTAAMKARLAGVRP